MAVFILSSLYRLVGYFLSSTLQSFFRSICSMIIFISIPPYEVKCFQVASPMSSILHLLICTITSSRSVTLSWLFSYLNDLYAYLVKQACKKQLPSVTKKYGVVSLTEHLRAPLNFLLIWFISPFASSRLVRRIWNADSPFSEEPLDYCFAEKPESKKL